MTIVDTTVWIDYFNESLNPHTLWLEQQIDRLDIALTDLILCELLQGFRHERDFAGVLRQMRRYEIFNSGGEEMAVAAAANYRLLRAQGLTVRKTADCSIATFCIQEGHRLLHRDRDFDPFEQRLGLDVLHPQNSRTQ
jgi:predicted nucleic acid-binding protein